ncbi:MAG TPA: N-acetylmuramoyl-L-alanine amidase [Dehalococcoidia bacterium]
MSGRRVTRREALALAGKGALAAGALALGLDLRPVRAGWITEARAGLVRAGTWHLPVPELARGTLHGATLDVNRGAVRAAASDGGLYVSPVLRASHPFQAVGVTWEGSGPAHFDVRASDDGRTWSGWTHLHEGHLAPRDGGVRSTEPAFVAGRYLQVRAALPAGTNPLLLRAVRVTYLDASRAPTLEEVLARRAERVAAYHAPGGFDIITRPEWGADESLRFPPEHGGEEWWPPEYQRVEKAIIHHSVTSNTQDPVQAVQAIYAFHAAPWGNDWGDIGYNYLVDRFGNVYEGRFGGGHVVAGHARQFNYGSVGVCAIGNFHAPAGGGWPSQGILDGLVRIVARRLRGYGVDPMGSSPFHNHPNLPNISGHRDVAPYTVDGGTSCPGDQLYAYLPSIRLWVRDTPAPAYAQRFVDVPMGDRMTAGAQKAVPVRVQNVGTNTWTPGGANPYQLRTEWYNIFDGRGGETGPRASVPGNVAPGQETTILMPLRAPGGPGLYGLRWDMIHSGVALFSPNATGTPSEGDVTYDQRVTVVPFQRTPASLLITAGRDAGPAGREVQMEIWGDWNAVTSKPWLSVTPAAGSDGGWRAVTVTVDPNAAPLGTHNETVTILSGGVTLGTVQVKAVVAETLFRSTAGGVSR